MSLKVDWIVDRLALKNKLNKWRILTIITITLFIIQSLDSSDRKTTVLSKHNTIARLLVEDVILHDLYRDKVMKEIADNSSIKAVVLHINSPGGTTFGAESLYNAIKLIAAHKPVVAIIGTMATSGGYMAALAADRIIAGQSSLTGSIGVLLQTAEVTALADKLGIKLLNFKSSPLKGAPSPLEPMTKESSIAINSAIEDSYQFFSKLVQQRRKLNDDQLAKVADGRIFTGNQAKTLKLIDDIGQEPEALKWLYDTKNINKALPIEDISLKRKSTKLQNWLEEYSSILISALTSLSNKINMQF
jgi:protease-4